MQRRKLFISLVLIASLDIVQPLMAHDEGHGAALGKPGDSARVSRTVEISMNDNMRFQPDKVVVQSGETIRFVVRNLGNLKHEMVLGTGAELKQHAAMMRKFPNMQHSDPNMVTVDAGKSGEMVWQFTQNGSFTFACLQPGHFEAGMTGQIAVATPKE